MRCAPVSRRSVAAAASSAAPISASRPCPRCPSPSQAAAHGELDAGLSRALLALGTPLREIVFCRLVLEMDFGEITSALQLSSAESARAQFHKALVRLRERLPGGDERG
jgi:DNA-directed RNA polymerase specialized sigma24 family protein